MYTIKNAPHILLTILNLESLNSLLQHKTALQSACYVLVNKFKPN